MVVPLLFFSTFFFPHFHELYTGEHNANTITMTIKINFCFLFNSHLYLLWFMLALSKPKEMRLQSIVNKLAAFSFYSQPECIVRIYAKRTAYIIYIWLLFVFFSFHYRFRIVLVLKHYTIQFFFSTQNLNAKEENFKIKKMKKRIPINY